MPEICLSWGHHPLVATETVDACVDAWLRYKHTKIHRGVPRFRALVRR